MHVFCHCINPKQCKYLFFLSTYLTRSREANWVMYSHAHALIWDAMFLASVGEPSPCMIEHKKMSCAYYRLTFKLQIEPDHENSKLIWFVQEQKQFQHAASKLGKEESSKFFTSFACLLAFHNLPTNYHSSAVEAQAFLQSVRLQCF